MKLQILSSSSNGNCYLLTDSGGNTLIVECGVVMADIKRALRFHLAGVVGCVVTHEHNDHARSVAPILKNGIKVIAPQSVFVAKGAFDSPFKVVAEPKKRYQLGKFRITPLNAFHDVTCLCYIVEHEDMGKLLFATDTYKIPYKIKGLTHMMIECNYSDSVLSIREEKGLCPPSLRDRLMLSHMELGTTIKVIKQNLCDTLQDVILLHLSNDNADGDMMCRECEMASGVSCYVAQPDKEFELNKTPY